MEQKEIESDPDWDLEFTKAAIEATNKYEQSATRPKRPPSPDVIDDFFIASPKTKSDNQRNFDNEIQRLQNAISKIKATIKGLEGKSKRTKAENKELTLAMLRLKKCEDDLECVTNVSKYPATL